MTVLASYQNLTKSFGGEPLFENLSIGFFKGEKLGLIGANGSGKSTLLKIFAGVDLPDDGEVTVRKQVRLIYLPQEDVFEAGKSVEEILLQAIKTTVHSDSEREQRVAQTLSMLAWPDLNIPVENLSGGFRKRLAIARAVICQPDLLFLDEPTNHLDMQGILWLEDLLKRANFAFVMVSHDRYFLQNATNRIVELGRSYPGGYFRVEGNYSDFLATREAFLESQQKQELVLQNKVRREVEWLRRGPKARTTKASARIDEAYRLQDDLSELKRRNNQNKAVQFDFEANDRVAKKLVKAHNLSKSMGERKLFEGLSFKLTPGTRLALMGPNGSGKSTLIKILEGLVQPDTGRVETAENLKWATFDQRRERLNPNELLRHALSPTGGESVIYRDKPVHIVTWAKKFLFQAKQLETPVGRLSGGEQARVLIAQLMLKPADVLFLDEPTNDLDIATLEVLEESLIEFPGAMVIVSHDRYLLDRVSTGVIGLFGDGRSSVYAEYTQWVREMEETAVVEKREKKSVVVEKQSSKTSDKKKLSFKHQYELDHIEEKIQEAENRLHEWQAKISDENIASSAEKLQEACQKMGEAQSEVEALYMRWTELEAM